MSPEGYASCCEALAKEDLRESILKIRTPVLVIAGDKDPVTTVDDAQWMHSQIQGSQMASLAASHISNIEAELQFNEAIKQFFIKQTKEVLETSHESN
jgi:3-oxoadipate enol-lactonase